jgi:hypothetical protein
MPKAFREGGQSLFAAAMTTSHTPSILVPRVFLAKRRFAGGAILCDTSPLPKSGSQMLAELRPPLNGEVGVASRICA